MGRILQAELGAIGTESSMRIVGGWGECAAWTQVSLAAVGQGFLHLTVLSHLENIDSWDPAQGKPSKLV